MPKDVSWDGKSGRFVWWTGEVRLGAGFYYQVDQGADSYMGHFSAFHGDVTIQHDMGAYAGAWAKDGDAATFREWCVEGAMVWISNKEWPIAGGAKETLYAVTFPDSGSANFYVVSSREVDGERIERIAKSYRPRVVPGMSLTGGCPSEHQ